MSATLLNGKAHDKMPLPRKQLSEQLDRLDEQLARHDAILDALAEGLNEAVKDAAQVGVQQAVKEAVLELLTNPELRQALHQASAPLQPAKPTFWQRCKAKVQDLKEKTKQTFMRVRGQVGAKIDTLKTVANNALVPSCRIGKLLLLATGVGLLVTLFSSVMSHHVAATLSGLGAAATTLAVQIGLWIRHTVKRLTCS